MPDELWTPLSVLPDLRRVGVIAIDIETKDGGLLSDHGSAWPWGDGYIAGISVAYRVEGNIHAHYFPVRHPDSPNFDCAQVIEWLRDHLAADLHIVGHNTLYDFGWLRADFGLAMPPPERLEETAAAATLVDENRHKYSLDALCAWRKLPGKDQSLLLQGCDALGLIPKRKRKKFDARPHIWQLPASFVGPYAEGDAGNTLALRESLTPVLEREKTVDAYRLEVALLPMILEMRRRGIRVDLDAAEHARELLLQKRDDVLKQISEQLGTIISMDEVRSRKWLVETFDREGIQYPTTKKGNPSFKGGHACLLRFTEFEARLSVGGGDG